MLAAAAGSDPGGNPLVGFVVIIASVALYWMPSLVAWRRGARNLGSVIVVNFFGFLFVTWIVALAMALADPKRAEAR
jgi:hypothetical protein